MPEILTAGEVLVEIMRKELDVPLYVQGTFQGPFPSGAPAIFIDQAACLGHSSAIIGEVGKDQFGERILKRLDIDGVDISYIHTHPHKTTACAFVSYDKSGDRKFIYHIADAAAGSIEMPPAGRLEGVKLFHVMGCSLMVNRNTRRVIEGVAECVKSQGGLISYDPNIRPELLKEESIGEVTGTIMGMTDIFLPGEKELLQAAGKSTVDEALEQALDAGASAVVLKKGREGARFVSRQSDILVKPYSIEEVDPTGAGDAFDAGFVCGYLEGLGPEQALLLAGACGALNASYLGPMEGVFHRNYVDYFIGK